MINPKEDFPYSWFEGKEDPKHINRRLAAAARAIERLKAKGDPQGNETPVERIMRMDRENEEYFKRLHGFKMDQLMEAKRIYKTFSPRKREAFVQMFRDIRYPPHSEYIIGQVKRCEKCKRENPEDSYLSAATQRLADKAMELSDGDVEGTANWLKSIGAKDVYISENKHEAHLTGPSGIRTGFTAGMDPPTCAVILGFAIAGMFWPQAFPGLLPEVNLRWRRRTREGPPGPGISQRGQR